MCYNGYSSKECHVHTEDKCHYITKPCTYKDGYGCKPTKERICNQISKPKCTGAGASIQCTNLYNQHCKVKPVIKCIQVPVVTVSDHCETKTVNNCNEVSSSECLTIYKTQCEEPEKHEICLDPSGQHCQVHNLPPVINRVCEGQQKEVCFVVPNIVCNKHPKEHWVDIPIIKCEKNYIKKCFKVPVPPQLVQVPKLHCHPGGPKQVHRGGAQANKKNRGYPYKQ